jgi:hypothetical protein
VRIVANQLFIETSISMGLQRNCADSRLLAKSAVMPFEMALIAKSCWPLGDIFGGAVRRRLPLTSAAQ